MTITAGHLAWADDLGDSIPFYCSNDQLHKVKVD